MENDKTINGIHYKPIFPCFDCNLDSYEKLLGNLVVGEGKGGTEILKGKETLFYGYGANTFTSSAQNIILGFLDKEYSYFIKECFDSSTIYGKNPEIIGRGIIRILHWKRKNAKYELFPTLDIYSRNLQIPKEAFDYWKILEPKIVEFQDAFREEQLEQLRLMRRK